jgi:hypothetical protein
MLLQPTQTVTEFSVTAREFVSLPKCPEALVCLMCLFNNRRRQNNGHNQSPRLMAAQSSLLLPPLLLLPPPLLLLQLHWF